MLYREGQSDKHSWKHYKEDASNYIQPLDLRLCLVDSLCQLSGWSAIAPIQIIQLAQSQRKNQYNYRLENAHTPHELLSGLPKDGYFDYLGLVIRDIVMLVVNVDVK